VLCEMKRYYKRILSRNIKKAWWDGRKRRNMVWAAPELDHFQSDARLSASSSPHEARFFDVKLFLPSLLTFSQRDRVQIYSLLIFMKIKFRKTFSLELSSNFSLNPFSIPIVHEIFIGKEWKRLGILLVSTHKSIQLLISSSSA
jgi:hypothetical protein